MRVIHQKSFAALERAGKAGPLNVFVTAACFSILLLLSCQPAIGQSLTADNDVLTDSFSSGLASQPARRHYRELSLPPDTYSSVATWT